MNFRNVALLLLFVIAAASCGGSDTVPGASGEAPSVEAPPVDDTSGAPSDNANPVCDLFTTSEVEAAIDRVVTDVVDQGGTDGFGACSWQFEPLTEGLFEGTPPELIVQTFRTTEVYDNDVSLNPDQPMIEGIGNGALSRADGEVTFSANGNSGRIGSLFAFGTGEEDAANAAVQQLAVLLADRL